MRPRLTLTTTKDTENEQPMTPQEAADWDRYNKLLAAAAKRWT